MAVRSSSPPGHSVAPTPSFGKVSLSYWNVCYRDSVTRFFASCFFIFSSSPKPLKITLESFQIFRKFVEIFISKGAPPVSTTLAANFATGYRWCCWYQWQICHRCQWYQWEELPLRLLNVRQNHGLINYKDTKANFGHLKKLTFKGILRQVFTCLRWSSNFVGSQIQNGAREGELKQREG